MDGYELLARCYNRFTRDVDYAELAGYVEAAFAREGIRPGIVLELGCGSGSLTVELARRGYDMIGVDCSPAMLSEASMAAAEAGARVLLLQQDMRALDLYGTVDAVVCLLDGMNCLLSERDLDACLRGVSLFLAPGGLLLFDLLTPFQLREGIAGQTFVYEDERDYLVWRSAMDGDICRFELDLFTREGCAWRRESGEIFERAWEPGEIECALEAAGLALRGIYHDRTFERARDDSRRVHIVAIKE